MNNGPEYHEFRLTRWIRFIVLLTFLIGLPFSVFLFMRSRSVTVISPLPEEPVTVRSIIPRVFSGDKTPDNLATEIKKLVGTDWVNYSVLVVDLNGKFRMGIGDSVIYTAASLNKVPILAALYYNAQKGNVDLDQVITLQKEDIQDYGTGSIRYASPGTPYSVKTLARLMIEQSDNTASYILANQVLTVNQIQEYIDSWGLTQTDMVNNKTSNSDMATIFAKIYTEKIANKALTQEMLSFFSNTDFNDRLAALLPPDVKIYHKIGSEIGNVHDVGIVAMKGKSYYIGVLTEDITDETGAVQKIADISKLVFDYLK